MKPRVLLVEDDEVFVQDLLYHLGDRFEWITLPDGMKVLETIKESLPDIVLLDIELGEGPDGLELLSQIRLEARRVPTIMVTRHDPMEMAAEAWRRGAFGYIEKSVPMEQLAVQIERAIEEATISRERQVLREELAERSGRLVGESPPMQEIRRQIANVARTSSTVLIAGETGTGKELIARAIHDLSDRSRHLFVPVCCPAIPESLAESEYFGHEKGAFTGALKREIGRFELAHRGTIFLDEIAEIPPMFQAKLLRVLQGQGSERQIQRVGGTEEIVIDVRVIAATNRDLEAAVKHGDFREDLYERLNVVHIQAPTLRERREDIPTLVEYILDRKTREMKRLPCRLTSAAMDRFIAWDWPRNVRQLENVLENALVDFQGEVLGEELFISRVGPGIDKLTYADARARVLERFEGDYVNLMLSHCGANISETARRMGLSREGLRKMMKRLGITRPTAD